jgi:hypothetical protein
MAAAVVAAKDVAPGDCVWARGGDGRMSRLLVARVEAVSDDVVILWGEGLGYFQAHPYDIVAVEDAGR